MTVQILTPKEVAHLIDPSNDASAFAALEQVLYSHEALREQLAEAQVAVQVLAEAVQNYFAGCLDNKYGKPCGGDWPCGHIQTPMKDALALLAVQRAIEAGKAHCPCWRIIDRNEGRTGTIRWGANPDCPKCYGTGKETT